MVRRGAKHLVLLSRSGTKSDTAKELVSKLESQGIKIYAPPCDISIEADVKSMVSHIQATWPPIKGCIHGALVVKVHIPSPSPPKTHH
jgi:NAD(P)-dependent dehydrogenase (short-subunit alcohol dehydrogenase family)